MFPVILHDSRLLDGLPTATDTADGYSVLNLRDGRTFTWWKGASPGVKYITVECPAAAAADAVGLVGHNLGSLSGTIAVESSPDGVEWTQRLAPVAPGSDKAFLRSFTSVSAKWWRARIETAGSAAQIAVLLLGSRLVFERPLNGEYDPQPETIEGNSVRSKTGHLLGSVTSFVAVRISAGFKNLTSAWINDQFRTSWEDHLSLLLPFLWCWDPEGHTDEVHWVKIADGFSLRRPFTGPWRSLQLEMEGVRE